MKKVLSPKIAVVVLHYNNIADTRRCLSSLEKYRNSNFNIVVVDNGSPQEKVTPLEKEFNNDYYIYSPKNLGFAKGNNLGFKFAKEKLKADIIILANNDTVFNQPDFVEKLTQHWKKGFDVAGPSLLSSQGKINQNPVPTLFHNVNEVNKRLRNLRVLHVLAYLNLDITFKNMLKINNVTDKKIDTNKNDFQLYGACLIFSGNYVKNYDGLYDKTFMYGEESILKYITVRDNLKLRYFDDLVVNHVGGSTMEKIYGSGKNKRKFYYYWNIQGCKILKKLMESNN